MSEDNANLRTWPLRARWLRWGLLAVLSCILLVALAWAGLQTRWAKDRLSTWVAGLTADTDGYQVTLEGLNGLIPFSITLDRLTLSDAKGMWLEGRRMDISIRPAALLSAMLDINRCRIGSLSISRLPQSVGPAPQRPAVEPELRTLSLPRVMVREMTIDRVDLEEAVAGAPLSYRLESNARTGGPRLEIDTLFQDLNHPNDALRLAAVYDIETDKIEADLTYRESRGGLAAGLMGLREATGIGFQLRVNGPLSEAEGRLDLDVGGYGKAGLDLDIGLKGPLSLALAGQVQADPAILPADMTAALGSAAIAIDCLAHMSSDQRVQIRKLTVTAPSSALSLQGTADLGRGSMDMRATLSPLDVSPFFRRSGIAVQGLEPVQVTASGAFSQPEMTLSTSLDQFASPDATLKGITMETRFAFEAGYRGLKEAHASVTATEVMIPRVPRLKGPLRVRGAATSPDFRKWQMKRFRLTAPEIVASSEPCRFDIESGQASVDLLAQINRLAILMPTRMSHVDGQLVLRLQAKGNSRTLKAQADLDMDMTRLSGLPDLAEGIVGPRLTLKARAGVNDGMLTLENIQLTADQSELHVQGRVHLGKGTIDGQYRLSVPDLTPIGKALDVNLFGRGDSEGRISGAFENAMADIAVSFQDVQVNDRFMKELHARLEVKGLPEQPSGSLRLEGVAMDQPVQVNAPFWWSGNRLSLSGVKADLPGIDLDADIDVAMEPPGVSGTAAGKIGSLKPLSALLGLDMEGTGRFQFKAGAPNGRKGLTLNADFKDLRYDECHIAALHIAGQVEDLNTYRGSLRLEAGDAIVKGLHLTALQGDLKGTFEKAAATVEAKGFVSVTDASDRSSDAPLAVSTTLHMSHDASWRFSMDRFKLRLGAVNAVLARPATVTMQDRKMALDELQLNVSSGRVQVKGCLDEDTVDATVRMTALPAVLLAPLIQRPLSGTVSGGCEISGSIYDPALHADLHIRDYPITRQEGAPPMFLDARLDADRRGDRFEAGLTLSGLDTKPFTATASLPARLSLRPFSLNLDRNAEIRGQVQGRFDLRALQGLPGMGDHVLTGDIEVDMGVGGSAENWALKGGIGIHDARYENPDSGTILSDINGQVQADGRALRLMRMTATDGEKGTIALEGGIALAPPFPIDADLGFRQSTLLRKDIVTSTASGKLDLAGTPKRLDLKGKIILDRTELEIPRRLPPEVVVIPVKEINLPSGMDANQAGSSQEARGLSMDLSIHIPARFFVRGRGLDAEFKGELTARGPVDNPVIRGTLNVVRGTFQFLTRTFHITQGQIAFDGTAPPVPFLNITTQVSAGQIDAQVRVTGPTNDFNLTLTSQPPMPQDEIMANILFGQSVAKLNAFQAYQLAASISQLSGAGIPDVVGKTRGLLGVDRLTLSGGDPANISDRDRGPTVSAGKYVSEGIYVGIEQELTDAKQDVVIEADITPNLSVESRAGTRSGAGIGFNWKYDY